MMARRSGAEGGTPGGGAIDQSAAALPAPLCPGGRAPDAGLRPPSLSFPEQTGSSPIGVIAMVAVSGVRHDQSERRHAGDVDLDGLGDPRRA